MKVKHFMSLLFFLMFVFFYSCSIMKGECVCTPSYEFLSSTSSNPNVVTPEPIGYKETYRLDRKECEESKRFQNSILNYGNSTYEKTYTKCEFSYR